MRRQPLENNDMKNLILNFTNYISKDKHYEEFKDFFLLINILVGKVIRTVEVSICDYSKYNASQYKAFDDCIIHDTVGLQFNDRVSAENICRIIEYQATNRQNSE